METVTIKDFPLSAASFDDGAFVVREGKIFECGDYPEKQFSMSPAEMFAAVEAFEPAPVKLQHSDTPLDGKLGEVQSITTDGKNLYGRVRLPKWLDDILPTKAVSASWDRESKLLNELSIVTRPHIADAALYAAFATANPTEPTPVTPKEKPKAMPTFEEWFGEFKKLIGSAPAEFKGSIPESKPAPQPAEESDEIKKLRADNAKLQAEKIATNAAAFALEIINSHKALPAEKDAIVAAYTAAASDDAAHGAATFADGKTGSRVDALKALYTARVPHKLIDGQPNVLAVLDANGQIVADPRGAEFASRETDPTKPKAGPMSPERRRELLGHVPGGKEILKEGK